MKVLIENEVINFYMSLGALKHSIETAKSYDDRTNVQPYLYLRDVESKVDDLIGELRNLYQNYVIAKPSSRDDMIESAEKLQAYMDDKEYHKALKTIENLKETFRREVVGNG